MLCPECEGEGRHFISGQRCWLCNGEGLLYEEDNTPKTEQICTKCGDNFMGDDLDGWCPDCQWEAYYNDEGPNPAP